MCECDSFESFTGLNLATRQMSEELSHGGGTVCHLQCRSLFRTPLFCCWCEGARTLPIGPPTLSSTFYLCRRLGACQPTHDAIIVVIRHHQSSKRQTRTHAHFIMPLVGKKPYPKATIKKIVKAHSNLNIKKNADVTVSRRTRLFGGNPGTMLINWLRYT